MQISAGFTRLYRPPAQSVRSLDAVESSKRGNATSSTPSIVLDSAKATAPMSFRDSARQKLDADYAKAVAAGTRVVVDTAFGGRHLDVSGLSDRELAAVAKGQGFSKDEGETAKAELAQRMGTALAPFQGRPGDQARAIKAMYPALPQDVKDALGWNEAMLAGGDRIIEWDERQSSSQKIVKPKSLFDLMLEGQEDPKALRVDMSLVQIKGGSISAVA